MEGKMVKNNLAHDMKDRDFWLTEHDIPLNCNNITIMAVHGALCLALRHPQFRGGLAANET